MSHELALFLPVGGVYLLLINIVGLIAMGLDKRKAKRQVWRIPEAVLFLLAFLGGSAGSILGMQIFRHKTKHPAFRFGLPVLFFLQCALLTLCYFLFFHP